MQCAPHIRGILAMLILALVIFHAPMSQAGSDQPDDAGAAPAGRLVQPRGADGCIHRTAINRCARGRALTSPEDLVVSPDGRHVYVASYGSHAVAVFARSRRTGLPGTAPRSTRVRAPRGRGGGCAPGRALGGPARIAISPDGRNVYVAASGSDALGVFARNRRTGRAAAAARRQRLLQRAARRRLHRRSRAERADQRRGEP